MNMSNYNNFDLWHTKAKELVEQLESIIANSDDVTIETLRKLLTCVFDNVYLSSATINDLFSGEFSDKVVDGTIDIDMSASIGSLALFSALMLEACERKVAPHEVMQDYIQMVKDSLVSHTQFTTNVWSRPEGQS